MNFHNYTKPYINGLVLAILFVCGIFQANGQADIEPLPQVNKNFLVVVHVVKDSLGQQGITELEVENYFEGANSYFEPIGMSFTVCQFNVIDNWQYSWLHQTREVRELSTLHVLEKRINVFLVDSIGSDLPFGICGLGSLEGISDPSDVLSSGVWMKKEGCGVITLTHELGHYFGLPHTFEDTKTSELVDKSNCETTADRVCDTSADPYIAGEDKSSYIDDCVFISELKDANGDYYTPDVSNMMSYYGGCRCGFTHGQYKKMIDTYLDNPDKW